MNQSNHKALGRYCYGGHIYAGQCSKCGYEHLLTADQAQEMINNCYLAPQTKLQQAMKGRIAAFQKMMAILF
jgi:hypothetical protein